MNQETPGLKSRGSKELSADFLLSLNLGASFLSAGVVFVIKSASTNINDSFYLALRSVYRVNDFLGLLSVNPVSTGALRREIPGRAEQLAAEITMLITGFALMACFLLFVHLLSSGRLSRQVLDFARLPILLFAGPAGFVLISYWTWDWPSFAHWGPVGNFYQNCVPFLLFITEFLCLSATVFRPNRRRAKWAITVFAIFHWAFWVYFPWKENQNTLFPMHAQNLMLILLPASTLLWVWREKPLTHNLAELIYRHRKVLYALSGAAVVLGVAVWHPARNVDMSHPRDWGTVEVALSRGPCFGPCAVYTMTVRGDGQVEYVGRERHSRIETRKSGRIGQEKILEILRDLDRAEFTTLDGRAFRWAFDTPSVGVRASVDGRTRVVVSDAYNERSSVGRQTRFLEEAGEIDSILRSTTWSQCEGECGGSEANR